MISTTPSGSRLVSAVTRRSQKGRVCVLSRWGARIQPASRSRKRQASTSGRTSETSVSATLRCSAPGCSQGTLCAISSAVAAMRWRARRKSARRRRKPVRAQICCATRACPSDRRLCGTRTLQRHSFDCAPCRHFMKQLRTWRLRPAPARYPTEARPSGLPAAGAR